MELNEALKVAEGYVESLGNTASEKMIKSMSQGSLGDKVHVENQDSEALRVAKDYVEDIGNAASEKLIKSMSQESLEGQLHGEDMPREGSFSY